MTTHSLACCPVCYEAYSSERPARILRLCGHDLCDPCVRGTIKFKTASWKNGSSRGVLKCPTCRALMISGEQITDYLRILTHTAACASEIDSMKENKDLKNRQFQREELAEILLEELFPRSFSLTSIGQKLGQMECETGKDILRSCSMKELIEELKSRLPELDSQLKVGLARNENPVGVLQEMVKQVANTWTQGWEVKHSQTDLESEAEVTTISYVDGIEELSLSMVWLFVLWLYKGVRFVYKEFLVLSLGKSGTRAQLLAVLQGMILFAASSWYCITLLQSNSRMPNLSVTQGRNG